MIFPDYENGQFSYWNANEWAHRLSMKSLDAMRFQEVTHPHPTNPHGKSAFLDPVHKERLHQYAKEILRADVLYGGYLENRKYLWRGSYMEPSKFIHLGLDFSAPAETGVCIDCAAELIQVYCDSPEESGWGTRLMFRLIDHPGYHLVFGHLRPSILYEHRGDDRFSPGQIIGYLGGPEQNGGWASHLHVQAIYGDVQPFLDDPTALDGYGEIDDLEALAWRYPDPMRFIKLA